MNNIKAILWDADGVLTLPEEYFSILYARSHGMDPGVLEPFFKSPEFKAATVGKADIKEFLARDLKLWQWQGSVDELLELWFETENVRNDSLLDYVQELRQQGTSCYLATNQEKHRGEYMKTKMFPGEFDDYFVSADMGVQKPDLKFFQHILTKLKLPPENIAYFDDTPEHVEAAKKLGVQAHLYQSLDHVKHVLADN